MIFLKTLCECCFLLIMLGPVSAAGGCAAYATVAAAFADAVLFTFSFALREKKPLRIAVCVPAFTPVFLPVFPVTGKVVGAILAAYCVFLAITDNYMPDTDHQKKIFKATVPVLLGTMLIAWLARAGESCYSTALLAALLSLAACVLLLRSLRHESEVYTAVSFQLINILTIAVFLAIVLVLSLKPVYSAIIIGLQTAGSWIGTVFIYVITGFLRLIMLILSWLKKVFSCNGYTEQHDQEPVTLADNDIRSLLGDIDDAAGPPAWIRIIFTVIGIAAAVVIVYVLFRVISGNLKTRIPSSSEDEKNTVSKIPPSAAAARTQASGVRKHYRRYLKYLRESGQDIAACETSKDVEDYPSAVHEREEARELRELYLRARYGPGSGKDDTERAKQLVKILHSEYIK